MVEELDKRRLDVVAWSMDIEILKNISFLLDKANLNYLDEDYYETSKNLIAIKLCFINSLSVIERKGLDKLEAKMKVPSIAHQFKHNEEWLYSGEFSDTQRLIIRKLVLGKNNLKKLVEDYWTIIMDLLDQYGYIAKKKRDESKLAF